MSDTSDTGYRRRSDSSLGAFFKANLGWIVTSLIAFLAWQRDQGRRDEILANMQRTTSELVQRVEKIDSIGSGYAQKSRWMLEQHSEFISDLTRRSKVVEESIVQMKSDLRLLARWAEEQQEARKRPISN